MSYTSNFRTKMVLGAVLAGLTFAGATIATANERQTDSITVTARDLDLRTHTGAATLRHRVVAAAYKLCREQDGASPIDGEAFGECTRDAIRSTSLRVETLIAAAQGSNLMASAAGPSR